MSTLGKVLSILVALSLIGWVFLAALVAKHHENWGQKISELKAEVEALKPELPPLVSQVDENRSQANLLQLSLEKARLNFRSALTRAQTTESDTKEALSRFSLQDATAKQEVTLAQEREAVRTREKNDLDKAILKEQAGVQELMAENKALKEQLAGLQKAFIDTLAENKSYTDRLQNAAKAPAATGPRTRLGSLVR